VATRTPLHGKLPRGVQDLFLADAARRAALEARLATVFRAWGYAEIVPPTFEYYENLALGLGSQVQEATYRFLDHRGHTLALRPDITVQTARIVGTKLADQPMPQRFYYIAPVFRYTEVQAGRQREFTQAGIELVGAASSQADAEVVALAVEALRAAGAPDFRVAIGQINFFRSVLAALNLPPATAERVQVAVDHKSAAEVRAILDGQPQPSVDLLARIPGLVGGPEVLDEARALASPPSPRPPSTTWPMSTTGSAKTANSNSRPPATPSSKNSPNATPSASSPTTSTSTAARTACSSSPAPTWAVSPPISARPR